MKKTLAIAPFFLACSGKPDFSELTSFTEGASCSENPVGDFILREGEKLTAILEETEVNVSNVTYYGIADRSDITIEHNQVRENVHGLEVAFFEGGEMLLAYRNPEGAQVVGQSAEGDAYGYGCDDGTIVAQYFDRNLLVVGQCSFKLNDELIIEERCVGDIYYKCPYSPEFSLGDYGQECTKLGGFNTENTPVYCLTDEEFIECAYLFTG